MSKPPSSWPGSHFQRTQAYARLQQGARHIPPPPTDAAALAERLKTCQIHAAGWILSYALERVTPAILQDLEQLANETALHQRFVRLWRGDAPAPMETPAHLAMRDLFSDLPADESFPAQEKNRQRARTERDKWLRFLGSSSSARGEPFTDLIQVGIGGSELGTRCLAEALSPWHLPGRRLHFVSNIDPHELNRALSEIDPRRTFVCVTSKSGTTVETLHHERSLRRQFRQAGLETKRHFVAVTAENTPLDRAQDFQEVFHLPANLGGRFSVTSAVGGLPLSFLLGSKTFDAFLRGARVMDINALEPRAWYNLPLALALLGVWKRNLLGLSTLAVLPYSQALVHLPAYLQQLSMESNGKSESYRGESLDYPTAPIIWGGCGTNSQHAFSQFLHQGSDATPSELIGFLQPPPTKTLSSTRASLAHEILLDNLFAQAAALSTGATHSRVAGKRGDSQLQQSLQPTTLILAEKFTPFHLGALVALYEHRVVFEGLLWEVNMFGQEGVELGKHIAKKLSTQTQLNEPLQKSSTAFCTAITRIEKAMAVVSSLQSEEMV